MASNSPDATATEQRSYLRRVHQFPMLSEEEEHALWRRWRDEQDPAAADRLVTSHLRLVTKIAQSLRGYGFPPAELIGEGNLGLMQALRRFDPALGRFAAYASSWIRAAMNDHVLHNWSMVKLGTTTSQKRLFFSLRRLKAQLDTTGVGELRPEQAHRIAQALDVPERDVISMDQRLAAADYSLNASVGSDAVGDWQDLLVDPADSQETVFAGREELSKWRARLPAAIQTLRPRERHIIIERRLKEQPATLKALAQHYGVSQERIRQIEMQAMLKLRKAMKCSATATQYQLRKAA